MPETEPNPDLVAILAWYKAMGVDAAVAGEAVDWLAHGDTPPGAALASLLSRPRTAPAQPPALTAVRPSITGAPARPLPAGPVPRTAERRSVPVAPPDEAVMA